VSHLPRGLSYRRVVAVLKSLTLRTLVMFRQVRSTLRKPSNSNLLATLDRKPPMSMPENAA
jgi:hypothetical protein